MEMSLESWVIVFRSQHKKAANERSLVLQARGIPHDIQQHGGQIALLVPSAQAPAASAELASYDQENVGWPPREQASPLRSNGLVGVLLYCGLLLLIYPMGQRGFLGFDLRAIGGLDATAIRAGQIWRSITALSLHADASHLAGNLVFGAGFALLASHQLGAGLAWLCILLAAASANVCNAWVQAPGFVAIGASTANFAALGLIASFEWIRRRSLHLRPLRRMAPLLGAAALLGYLGMGSGRSDLVQDLALRSRTDVIGHLAGFVAGLGLGVALARSSLPERCQGKWQNGLGATCLLVLGLAWACAFAT